MEQPSQEVKSLIRAAVTHKRKIEGQKISLSAMSAKLKISHARLSSYHTGSRVPSPDIVKRMARYFYAVQPAQDQFVAALDKIRSSTHPPGRRSGRSLIEQLASGEKLRVNKLPYGPFSGSAKVSGENENKEEKDKPFFDKIFDRFYRLSGLVPDTSDKPDFDLRETLWNDRKHLGVAYFTNVYRSLLVHFWPTPIRMSLGAVILKVHAEDERKIQEVLVGQRRSTRYRPIVVREEVGAIHCMTTLGFSESEVDVIDELNPKRLAKMLQERKNSSLIPVVVVNEYTSFQVLSALGNEGFPVVALSSRQAVRQEPGIRRELPEYFLSFACSRKQQELRDMIEESFGLFLATEVETTSQALASLHRKLMDELEEYAGHHLEPLEGKHATELDDARRFELAYLWTLYALGLDQDSIRNYPRSGMPWRAILE